MWYWVLGVPSKRCSPFVSSALGWLHPSKLIFLIGIYFLRSLLLTVNWYSTSLLLTFTPVALYLSFTVSFPSNITRPSESLLKLEFLVALLFFTT